jgi:OmpA-OmpF porin, OOP family
MRLVYDCAQNESGGEIVIIRLRALAVAALAWCAPLAAVQTPQYDVPYLGAATSVLSPDRVRNSDAVSGGFALRGGWPLAAGTAVELRFSDHEMRRKLDNSSNYQTSLFVDYVRDFGTTARGEGGFLRGTKFFVLGGVGLVREDSYGDQGDYVGLAAGAGALIPLGFRGWAIRLDGRAQAQINGDLCNDANTAAGRCTRQADYLLDYMFEAGLQIPLTMFFARPPPVAPAEECPVAVVDPDAPPRADCVADSDRDGVPDESDQCPGTPPGSPVGAAGCPR